MAQTDEERARYKQTEKRLYRYKSLCRRICDHKHDIEELNDMNFDKLRRSSKSFVSMMRSGMRLDPTDVFDAQIGLLKSYVAVDEYEVRQIKRALRYVRDDPYYMTVEYKYFNNMSDEEASRAMKCSLSTIRRNRTKLVKRICDLLYGM